VVLLSRSLKKSSRGPGVTNCFVLWTKSQALDSVCIDTGYGSQIGSKMCTNVTFNETSHSQITHKLVFVVSQLTSHFEL
jgi:hypothetical protein